MTGFLRAVKRILGEAVRDNITGEAAKVAFYLFLSLFPLLLVLFGLTGILGGDDAFRWIMAQLRTAAPGAAADFLERFVRDVTDNERPGLLSLGLVILLWAASGGVAALGDGLNAMYDVEEGRGWVRKRLLALGLLAAVSLLMTTGAALVVAGPELFRTLGMGGWANLVRWPAAFGLLLLLFWILYFFLPDRDQRGVQAETLVGAVVGAAVWLMVTALFRVYVSNFGSYGETYGFVGAVMVLLFWLYLTSISILLGGEVAAVLEGRGGDPDDPTGPNVAGRKGA